MDAPSEFHEAVQGLSASAFIGLPCPMNQPGCICDLILSIPLAIHGH
jgi:hypothetical protein